jgi:hypothetical protein
MDATLHAPALMRRQRRDIEVRLPLGDVAAAARVLNERSARAQPLARRPTPGTSSGPPLAVRVRDDGRVRARIAEYRRLSWPPRLAGRITDGPSGTVLVGTIKESRNEVALPRLFTGLALLTAAAFVGLLATKQFTNPGVYICGIVALASGGLGYGLGRLRRVSFRIEADKLEGAIRQAVPS